jgi:hypothetical protein
MEKIGALFRVISNTHIGDLKEVTVNIFGPNKSKSSMEEDCMQNACNVHHTRYD